MFFKILSVIIFLGIAAVVGYGIGYNTAFNLQNANMRSTEIGSLGLNCKLLTLVKNDENDRALILIDSVIQSDIDYIKNLATLKNDSENFHIINFSDFTLPKFIETGILDTESEILEMAANDSSICEKLDFKPIEYELIDPSK